MSMKGKLGMMMAMAQIMGGMMPMYADEKPI